MCNELVQLCQMLNNVSAIFFEDYFISLTINSHSAVPQHSDYEKFYADNAGDYSPQSVPKEVLVGNLSVGSCREIVFVPHRKREIRGNFSQPVFTENGDVYVTKKHTQFMSEHFSKKRNNVWGVRLVISGRIRTYHEANCES